MMPLKLICESKNMRKDGTSIVFIQYCFCAEKRITINTKIAVPPAFWNRKRVCISANLPLAYGLAKDLNNELKRLKRLAEDILDFAGRAGVDNKGSFLKQIFSPDFNLDTLEKNLDNVRALVNSNVTNTNLNVYYQIDDYIKSKEKRVSAETIGVYRQMKDHLFAYECYRCKPITFESFDYNFYENYVEFLTYEYIQKRRKNSIKGLRVNTIGKSIKHLRGFIKDRVKRKIIPPIDLSDYKGMEEETDAIYLTEKEIEEIRCADLSEHPLLEKYRDLLVFGCLTGLRFSDFIQIKSTDVRGTKLFKKQEKSDHWVVIPLKAEAYQIFTEKFKRSIPIVSNPDFNYYIKEIGKIAGVCELITFSHKHGNGNRIESKPKYAWITSHTCRRSFCTNEFLAGIPVLLIMKISGHKKEKDFYRYIRITAEQAALQIEKLWQVRNNDKTFDKGKQVNESIYWTN